MFKSIRWKFILIFILLVLIAIVTSGVFIINFVDQYTEKDVEARLDGLSELMLPSLESYEDLSKSKPEVSSLVASHKGLGFKEEIFVVNRSRIIATSTKNNDRQAEEVLDFSLLVAGLKEQIASNTITIPLDSGPIRAMDKVYPIINQNGLQGLLYLRYDLKDSDELIHWIKVFILQSTVIALSITIVLSFIISRSITGPINDVTDKAYKMARGDFDQYVEVKSDDEIGKLAEMFNHLTRKLKLSMNEISREKNKLEAIVNNMADGLIAVTKSHEVLHINQMALSILNTHAINITKDYETLCEFLPESLNFNNLVTNHPSWSGSELIQLQDATYRVRIEPFFNELGKKEGLILVFQDITEHERLESMRKEFVANVSHELKTPLTSIKSYTETLLNGAADDVEIRDQFLQVIEAEADRMSRLVRDLLQLSNYDANRFDFNFVDHDWVMLMELVLKKMDLQIKAKRHDVKLISDSKVLRSSFDYDRMEQVVVNLVSNAVKYTPDGGRIRLFLTEDATSCTLKVMDTGDGIDQEHLHQLFDRFYRVDKARSRDQGGTGLGLAIAKEIIERHSGHISINSEIGKGTTVTMTIPKL